MKTVIFFALLCVIFQTVNSRNKLSLKKQENILPKLNNVRQRTQDVKYYRGAGFQEPSNSIANRNETHENLVPLSPPPLDYDIVIEAVVMRTILIRIFALSGSSIRFSSSALRIVGDTAAGLVSTMMRGMGGIMKLVASIFSNFSERVDGTVLRDSAGKPIGNGATRVNLAHSLRNLARLMFGIGQACIWGGEISEGLTQGIGEALEDSFRGLELLSKVGNSVVNFVFLNDLDIDVSSLTPPVVLAVPTGMSSNRSRGFKSVQDMPDVVFIPTPDPTTITTPSSSSSSFMQTDPAADSNNPSTIPTSSKLKSLQGDGQSAAAQQATNTNPLLYTMEIIFDAFLFLSTQVLTFHDYMVDAYETNILHRIYDSMEMFSMSLQLLIMFFFVFLFTLIPFRSFRNKFYILVILFIVCWVSIITMEYTQRMRLVHRTATRTIESYLSTKVPGFNYYPADKLEMDEDEIVVLNITNQVLGKLTREDREHAEHIAWVNIALSAVWTNLAADFTLGGYGPYMSEMYEEMLTTELSAIPPRVANLRLKRFDFGSNPPFIKGISAYLDRNMTCIDELKQSLLDESKGKKRRWEDSFRSFDEGLNTNNNDFASAMEKIFKQLLLTTKRSHHVREGNNTDYDHFSISCDRLYLDLDVIYASKDMDIELSLRSSDLKSVMPEMSVSLNEVIFAGQVRMGMQLTTDYPFIGNTTISFIQPPSIDFSLNSFGGSFDLSSIPLAYYFVNTSIHYVLRHYTAPHFTTVDMRHTICPACDTVPVPTLSETILQSTRDVSMQIRGLLQDMRKTWKDGVSKVKTWWKRMNDKFKMFYEHNERLVEDMIGD